MELAKTPSLRLDGKRALISGGGRGIGLAAATALADAGAQVTLVSRTAAEIDAAADALVAAGAQAEALVLDLTDIAAMEAAVGKAGPFDILINNAGTNRPKLMAETTLDDFDAIMGLNLRAAYFIDRAVTNGMIAAGRPGSILHISSQMGHVGGPKRTVYCASKFAIEGLTKAMAIEFALHNIRVNSIGPTFIDTPLARVSLEDPEMKAYIMSKIKLGRIGRVEDLMGAIVFLSSDAAAMITGAALLIDGGWTVG